MFQKDGPWAGLKANPSKRKGAVAKVKGRPSGRRRPRKRVSLPDWLQHADAQTIAEWIVEENMVRRINDSMLIEAGIGAGKRKRIWDLLAD